MRLRWVLLAAATTAAILVIVGATVPVPLVGLQPGPTFDVVGDTTEGDPLLTVRGMASYPTSGQLLMTTVAASGNMTLATALSRWVRGDLVVAQENVYEPGKSLEEADRSNRAQFDQSEHNAAAAAASYLHLPTIPNAQFGIMSVGGPSAGMILAIGLVDRLTIDDLLDGQRIAGTGTIDQQGRVGEVSGLAEKLTAARAAGADLFLVPAAECYQARNHAPPGMTLARVSSLDTAIAAIRTFRVGQLRAVC